jgi:hypothetical protein
MKLAIARHNVSFLQECLHHLSSNLEQNQAALKSRGRENSISIQALHWGDEEQIKGVAGPVELLLAGDPTLIFFMCDLVL